jgi:hypothetical protein
MHAEAKWRQGMPKKFDPMSQKSEERPQAECDQRAPGHDNNHPNDWVRGRNEDATRMPHFDKSPKFYITR